MLTFNLPRLLFQRVGAPGFPVSFTSLVTVSVRSPFGVLTVVSTFDVDLSAQPTKPSGRKLKPSASTIKRLIFISNFEKLRP
jgi:hypothetical protein